MATPTPNPDVYEYDLGASATPQLVLAQLNSHWNGVSTKYTREQPYAIAADGLVVRCNDTGHLFDFCRIDGDFIAVTMDTIGATNTINTLGVLGTYTTFTDHSKIVGARHCYDLGRMTPSAAQPEHNFKVAPASGLSQYMYVIELDDAFFILIPDGAGTLTEIGIHAGDIGGIFDACEIMRYGVLGYEPNLSASGHSGGSAWAEADNTASDYASAIAAYEDAGVYICGVPYAPFVDTAGRFKSTLEKTGVVGAGIHRIDGSVSRTTGWFKYVKYSRSSFANGVRLQTPGGYFQIAIGHLSATTTRFFIPWNINVSINGAAAIPHIPNW